MGKEYETAQENFWAGSFGDDYSKRNAGDAMLASNLNFFARVLARTRGVERILELGANVGMNLKAIAALRPNVHLEAVEINPLAVGELRHWGRADVHAQSLLAFKAKQPADLAFTKGVLIHIDPEQLPRAYDVLVGSSSRYVLVAEYYNPTPMTVPYRGHQERLFKRDFAGELLDRFPDLALVEYGFCYRRDPNFPQDDLCWFLLEKTGAR